MQTDPQNEKNGQQEDADNQGVSPVEPAEGSDDASAPGPDSPGH